MANLPLVWTEVAIGDHEKQRADSQGFLFRDDLPPAVAHWSVHEGKDTNGNKKVWRSLRYMCPGGCGQIGHVPVITADGHTDGWTWNGDLTAPTLAPSIQMLAGCRWHGYLTDGIWKQC